MSAPTSICVSPISPTYLPLHRYLYYTSLVLSVLYPTRPPLIKGAFAYSLTYSSTASLYSILILALPSPAPGTVAITNLDIFPLYTVLATAATLLLPLLLWTRSLPDQRSSSSGARSIIRLWGLLILTGTICSFVLLSRARGSARDGYPSGRVNCAALVAGAESVRMKLRDPSRVVEVSYERLFGRLFDLLWRDVSALVFVPAGFGAVSCLLGLAVRPGAHMVEDGLGVDSEAGSGAGGGFVAAFLSLRKFVSALTPCFFVPVLVVGELFLLKDWAGQEGVPEGEKIYEVGQWGLLVGLGFVSAAAGVDWVVSRRGEVKGMEEFVI